jgi:hypothetical protein
MAVCDVGLTNIALVVVYLLWVGALYTRRTGKKTRRRDRLSDDLAEATIQREKQRQEEIAELQKDLEGKDAQTIAAVKMKQLVNEQVKHAQKLAGNATVLKAIFGVCAMFAETDQVQGAIEHVEGEVKGMAEGVMNQVEGEMSQLLGKVEGEFMDKFSDMLDAVEDVANGIIKSDAFDGFENSLNAKINAEINRETSQLNTLIQDQVDNAKKSVTEAMSSGSDFAKDLFTKPTSASTLAKVKKYCLPSATVVIGSVAGITVCALFMWAPQGPVAPYRTTDGFAQRLFCDRDYGSPAWCHGQSIGQLTFSGGVYYLSGFKEFISGLNHKTILLGILKMIPLVNLSALLFIMLKTTVQPFANAAKPLEVLSAILSKWIDRKHATGQQLDAWVAVRKSFLHNECTLMLKENDSIVVFMLVVMCLCMLANVFLVFTQEKVAISAVIGAGICGFGALTCINAAIACYKEQQGHRSALNHLKEVIIRNDPKLCVQIDAILHNLQKQDYQTKLMFLPLNPVVLKGIIGYIVTGAVMIGGKCVALANGN